ncbi:MAG: class I SAM-dependent methyltransferase [Chloroflexi bacterium]|nr:class I SAM-dependent methyltransferase [Chloroflexota bacterium]
MNSINELLNSAFSARESFLDESHNSAFRMFNGFLEGFPALCIDIYARTALIHNYATSPNEDLTETALQWIRSNLPWVQAVMLKNRIGQTNAEKRGKLIFGLNPDRKICENGIWYAIDLNMNRDASFYMDTRNLRDWARHNLTGKTVLNSFAYTGSLGVAALAGGAKRVVQMDLNNAFLDIARKSCILNNLPVTQADFVVQDFFPAVGQFKKTGQTFDCVFLDPPFFAATTKGRVDLETGSTRLINKIRPVINDGGWLIAINNALFVSGADYLASLQALCADGYLTIEQLVPIPSDFTGYAQTTIGHPPVDPAPFNHSTKIAVLRVRKKIQPHS